VAAAFFCWEATILDCQILDNRGGHPSGAGGGIACGPAMISRCTIRGNTANTILSEIGKGGGILSNGATITDCWIENNVAGTGSGSGGGIAATDGSITNCVFVGNRAVALQGATGGGIACMGDVTISGSIFVRNSAHLGAAVAGGNVTGCTAVGNFGSSEGGVIALPTGDVTASIVAWNAGLAISGGAHFSCNLVFGNTLGDEISGVDGGGNLRLDPQFCAVDPAASMSFALQSDSPCAPGNHPDGASCGLIGAAPVGCGSVALDTITWTQMKSLYRR
jgi:hypothetical protein